MLKFLSSTFVPVQGLNLSALYSPEARSKNLLYLWFAISGAASSSIAVYLGRFTSMKNFAL